MTSVLESCYRLLIERYLKFKLTYAKEPLIKCSITAYKGQQSCQIVQDKLKIQSHSAVFAPFFCKRAQKAYAGGKVPPALTSIYKFALANSTYRRLRFLLSPR